MNIRELLKEGQQLLQSNSSSALLDAQLLLMYVLQVDKLYLMIHLNEEVPFEKIVIYHELLAERKQSVPIAYLIHKKPFYGRDFFVSPGVLIPRPDTEILIEKTLDVIPDNKQVSGIEIGCGSGAISITLLLENRLLNMVATDIEAIPIEITSKNANLNNVQNRLRLINTDLFNGIPSELFDFIISNPPYIPYNDSTKLMKDVVDYEPKGALFAEENGTFFYRKILEDGKKFLKKDGFVAFEIGCSQATQVRELCLKEGFHNIMIHQDLYGLDRVVIAFR